MELNRIAVLGTGIMGRQVTQQAAMCGLDVAMISQRGSQDVIRQALEAIRANLKHFFVDKGKMTAAEMEATLKRIKGFTSMKDGVNGAQVVVENVREDLGLKQQVFQKLDELCPPETVLASDSSGLMITAIASLTKRPERAIGMHFFTPVALMKLVEVVRGAKTSDKTVEVARELSTRLDKEAIIVNDGPGYVVGRLFLVLINEAAKLVSEGLASPEDVDKGCQLGLGHAMGPLRSCDMTNGIAHGMYTWEHMREILGEEYKACPLIMKKHMAGETGQPAGKGFYDWGPGTKETLIIKDAKK